MEVRLKKNKRDVEQNFDINTYKSTQLKIESYISLINKIEKNLTVIDKTLTFLNITIIIQKTMIGGLTNIPILPTKLTAILIDVKILLTNALKVLRVIQDLVKLILKKLATLKALLQDFLNFFNGKIKELLSLYNTVNETKQIDGYNGIVLTGTSLNSNGATTPIVFNNRDNTTIFKDNGFNFTYDQVNTLVLDLVDYTTLIDDLSGDKNPYRGYTFKIFELNSTIPNIKNRYAIAFDSNGVEAFRSETSFTLRPNVLIESLKFKIDNHLIINYKG